MFSSQIDQEKSSTQSQAFKRFKESIKKDLKNLEAEQSLTESDKYSSGSEIDIANIDEHERSRKSKPRENDWDKEDPMQKHKYLKHYYHTLGL